VCRVVAYLGEPLPLDVLLYRSDSSLVGQAYNPRILTYLNLAGCGVAAWDASSPDPALPFIYKDEMLPMYDRNLMRLARKIHAECVLAHIRGCEYTGADNPQLGRVNLHPFQFDRCRVALAHNGSLARFAEMRFALLEHIRAEVSTMIEGTTDSEWIYALVVSQLDDPARSLAAEELADAVERALRILRQVRERAGIGIASGANLFVSDGQNLVTTRFTYDFGCYESRPRPSDFAYQSLWYTVGREYGLHDGEWRMRGAVEEADSILIASEPLTEDISTWIEVPEYTMIVTTRKDGRLQVWTRDIDL
jgi:glutamine amidotransferase